MKILLTWVPVTQYSGLNCILQKICGFLTPNTWKYVLIFNRVFATLIKLIWGYTELQWALIQTQVSLQEEGNLNMGTILWDNGGRYQINASAKQEIPRVPGNRRCSPRNFQVRMSLATALLWISSLQNYERISKFLFKVTQIVVLRETSDTNTDFGSESETLLLHV